MRDRDAILKRQEAHWPRDVEEGKKGNPFATLCLHCYGRHKPPMDEICPNDPPKGSAVTPAERKSEA